MDTISAVGILASVEQLADGAFKLVSFVNTIKDGGKQRLRLFTELNALWMVLKLLEGHLEPEDEELEDPWLSTIAALDEDNGVFDQISAALEDLDNRLRPKAGHRKILQTLRWPFDKSDVEALVAHLERLKSAVDLALNSTSAAAIRALQSDTKVIKLSVADVELKTILTETIQLYVARARRNSSFDLDTSDLDQVAALHIAIQSRHLDILNVLIDAGVNLNAIDRLERTPLHWACLYDNMEAAGCLLDAGAKVHLEDHFEKTALDISLSNRHYDLVALMLEYRAWPKASKVQVALYAVAMYGSAALVRKLVDAGANPLHKDSYGQSPYHAAQDMENKEAAEMILSLCERPKQSSQDSTEKVDITVRKSGSALAC